MGFKLMGALAGASGQALQAQQDRDDEEREIRKARLLEQLRKDTAIDLAEFQEGLEAKKVDDKMSGFSEDTGEYIMRNSKGEEISRRPDAGMAKDAEFGRKKDALSLDVAQANIDQSRASADASRASAGYSRKLTSLAGTEDGVGKGRGRKGSYDNEDRLAAVNKIEDNLKSYGFSNQELATAREELLKGVRKNWSLEQFVEFERAYLAKQKAVGRTRALSDLDVAQSIFGKPKAAE